MLERETKFLVGDDFRLPPLDDMAPGLVAQPPEELAYATTYWDTDDRRLQRWRCSLRFRSGEGWTLKLPSSASDGLLSRPELPFAGDEAAPPEAATRLLRAYIRREALRPALRLATVRRRVRLLTVSGAKAAEVVDDRVRVGAPGSERAFREVEIELGPDADAAVLDAVARRLRAAGVGKPDLVSKLARAQGQPPPPPEVIVPDLGRRATAYDVARRAIALAVHELMADDPLVRVGDDPEAIHRARVATRRLRSDLGVFAPLFQAGWADALREDLRGLGSALGEVRDREVLRTRLAARATVLPAADQASVPALLAHLDDETKERRNALQDVLDADHYLDLLERLLAAAREPAFGPAAAEVGKDALLGFAIRPWRKLKRAVGRLSADPPDTALHQVRIRAKRYRYAAEALAPVIGKRARRLAERAAALQTTLGEHQDSVIAQAWLREAAGTGPLAFLAGELLILEVEAQRQARASWPAAWAALRRGDPRRW